MKIEMRPVTIRELIDQYVEDEDTGEVRAYGGKLDVRPKYQREFVYDTKDSEAVIHTVLNGFPLNTMYWVEREDGSYEVLDGQQRTISICRFATNTAYSVRLPDPSGKGYNSVNYPNLFDNQREDFLNYPLQVYFCSGTEKEKMDWFQTINIAGKALKKQEIRNAVYASPWLTDAKSAFSRRNCAAHKQYGKYLSGECLRQDYLETILEWAASRDNITSEDIVGTYMQQHRNDDNADPLWDYCERIFGWVRKTFGNTTRKEMKGLPWGIMYNEHHEDKLDPKDVQNEVDRLMADGEVQSKKGIYEYVLDGKEKHLSLRTFDDADKRTAYEKQQGICPLCHNHFEYEEMAGDHIKPWSKGGKTIPENCQMLCIPCNTGKSNH